MYREASIFYFNAPFFWCYLFFKNILIPRLEFIEFFLTCIFHHVWEKFPTYGVQIPRKYIESMHFYSCPSPLLKPPGRGVWKFVSLKTKWVDQTMIFFIKFESENMMILGWNISLFIFCISCNFSKCDGFTVLWIIYIK